MPVQGPARGGVVARKKQGSAPAPSTTKGTTMSFEDFKAFNENITVRVPTRDGDLKEYTIPPIDAKTGIELRLFQSRVNEIVEISQRNEQKIKNTKDGETPDLEELPDYEFTDDNSPTPQKILGEKLHQQLLDDGVTAEAVQLMTDTAFWDFLAGREAAEAYWNSGGDPKVLARATPAGSMPSTTNTGEENTTQKRASTSGTKSRKKTTTGSTKKGQKRQSTTSKSSANGNS